MLQDAAARPELRSIAQSIFGEQPAQQPEQTPVK
jgi:hypothetical protein